jgi:hypothetical protein
MTIFPRDMVKTTRILSSDIGLTSCLSPLTPLHQYERQLPDWRFAGKLTDTPIKEATFATRGGRPG